jgi:protein SCO1/2
MSMRARLILALAVLLVGLPAAAAAMLMELSPHAAPAASGAQRLPKIAPAPGFTLTSQDGAQVSLAKLRGKVVAVTFIFTRCGATCPMLTPMMSLVQDRLGGDFGSKIAFASITVDPEHDTPEMLKMYAQMYGADVAGWSFLTGTPAVIGDLTRRYGVFAAKNENGDVDHSLLTSIIDQRGILRVQYVGVRFDPEEFRRDLVSLVKER